MTVFINGVDSDVESVYDKGYSWRLQRLNATAFLSFANIKDNYAG